MTGARLSVCLPDPDCRSGYHLHFIIISADRKTGGHLLECLTGKVTLEIGYASPFCLELPAHEDFYKLDFKEGQG